MAFSSGCGGPSYDWSSDMRILIDGQEPRRPVPEPVSGWGALIYDAAETYTLPAHFLAGIMALESGGKADAGSPAGAMGLMQLIHSTANAMAGRTLSVQEVYDPVINVDLGAKFLRSLWDRYKGDPIKIAFGYNAGSARCGAGCVRDYTAPGRPCVSDCQPNQFNLVADCSSTTTVDYGGKVAAFANQALATDFPIDRPSRYETLHGAQYEPVDDSMDPAWLFTIACVAVGAWGVSRKWKEQHERVAV